MDISRRGMFGLVPGIGAVLVAGSKVAAAAEPVAPEVAKTGAVTSFSWARVELFRRGVIGEVGEDCFDSWFRSMEMEKLENGRLTVSVPVLFLKRWVETHYDQALLRGAQRMDASVEEVVIVTREPRVGRLPVKMVG